MVPFVWELRETPYGGTLWFRYSSEFTANTTTPPIKICYKWRCKTSIISDTYLRSVNSAVVKLLEEVGNILHEICHYSYIKIYGIWDIAYHYIVIYKCLCSNRENLLNSPIGFGTAMTCVQSKGRLLRDQMTGWTFCIMLREMATMLHVSWRTATRLKE